MEFKDMKIADVFLKNLQEMRITKPTQVQAEAIKPILKGKDLIVRSQTGTGKTLAFLLPILTKIDPQNPLPQCLILTPTRELALQIEEVVSGMAKGTSIKAVSILGGHNLGRQSHELTRRAQIVVGTPGRILDHLRRGTINFKDLQILVLDEADQMLSFGFEEDILLLSSKIPDQLQRLLFSATMPQEVVKLSRRILDNPVIIDINPLEILLENIRQMTIKTSKERKIETLIFLLEVYRPFMAMIFAKSKVAAKELYDQLLSRGYKEMELLHGELSQNKREQVLEKFRQMKIPYLITTDISARGMDIDGITHIINYDVPRDADYFIHRIGRTGRMGKDGIALTLLIPEDQKFQDRIEKRIGAHIPQMYDRNSSERKRIDVEALKRVELPQKKRLYPKKSKFAKPETSNRRPQEENRRTLLDTRKNHKEESPSAGKKKEASGKRNANKNQRGDTVQNRERGLGKSGHHPVNRKK